MNYHLCGRSTTEEFTQSPSALIMQHWMITRKTYQKNLERNKIMAERALPYIKSKPTAIAVGAAHFLCEPNMLNYFEKEGIKVKRVTSTQQ